MYTVTGVGLYITVVTVICSILLCVIVIEFMHVKKANAIIVSDLMKKIK